MEKVVIADMVTEARNALSRISDGHLGADVQHDRVKNLLAIAETELKFHELDQAETIARKAEAASIEQSKQTKAMIFWTKIMAFAVAAQVIVGGTQAFIYYKQLEVLLKTK